MPPGAGLKPLGGPVGGGVRPRLALTIAVGVGVACASYAGQRLGAWGLTAPGPMAVEVGAYTAYYWRLGLAVLHGVVAGSVCGLGVPQERARAWLLPAGRAVAVVVGLCVLSMALVP